MLCDGELVACLALSNVGWLSWCQDGGLGSEDLRIVSQMEPSSGWWVGATVASCLTTVAHQGYWACWHLVLVCVTR